MSLPEPTSAEQIAQAQYPPLRALDHSQMPISVLPVMRQRRSRWPLMIWATVALIGIVLLTLGTRRTEANAIANPELWFAAWPFMIAGWIGLTRWIVKGMD